MFRIDTRNSTGFRGDARGNVAMLFGLMLAPMVAAVGLGVDMSKTAYLRRDLAEAADAAVLAAARARLNDSSLTLAEASTIARKSFDLNRVDGSVVNDFALVFDETTDRYTVSFSTAVPTHFVKVVGMKTIPVDIAAEVTISPPRALEVALALDNTGSMSGTKLDTLKTASRNLADELLTDADNVKIGIVPFSNYVNVGLSRRNESWIDVPADESTSEYKCWNTYPDRKTSNCRQETKTCQSTNDGVTTTYPCTQTKCDVDNGAPVQQCGWKTRTQTWRGCVGSRDDVYDEIDGDYATRKIPGLLNIDCSKEVLSLTDGLGAVKSKIDEMSANGETYLPAGLAWGRRILSAQAPFSEGLSYADARAQQSMKALILMTDGENTKSANYPRHDGGSKSKANAKTEALCKSIKDDGIVIYAIAFEVTDPDTKALLQKCASTSDNYFDADNPAKLVAAFNDVANSLKDIALSK